MLCVIRLCAVALALAASILAPSDGAAEPRASAGKPTLVLGQTYPIKGAFCIGENFAHAVADAFEGKGRAAGLAVLHSLPCMLGTLHVRLLRVVREYDVKGTADHFTIVEVVDTRGATHFMLSSLAVRMPGQPI